MKPIHLGLVVAFILAVLHALVRGDEPIAVPLSRATDIDQRLKSIVVSVEFDNATIEQAIQALKVKSQEADHYHKGIDFMIEPEAAVTAKPITLKLDRVPLGETIRYVCLLSGVGYKVSDKLIWILPRGGGGDGFDKRTYHVDPSFVETARQAGVVSALQTSP